MIETTGRRSRGRLARLPHAMVWSLLLVFGSHGMAQQPDFRDGLYGPDDGPYEVLTFQTMDLYDAARKRRINAKISWPRDLPPVVGFSPPPAPPPEVCVTVPPEPPPLIGPPPPPKPPEQICGPDPNYTPPPPEIALAPRTSYPYPVIVWSHGPGEDFRNYYHLVHHLVSHGYVVVQVQHFDAKELAGTRITDSVNQSIQDAYTALNPQPQASDFSKPIGSGPGVVQLSGGPCYYRWVGSSTTLLNSLNSLSLDDFSLGEPYLAFLNLVVQPLFENVIDSVGGLVGATGLRLEYGCFESTTPDSTIQIPNASIPVTWQLELPTSLFDIPGWYFIPALGGNDPSTPSGQYYQTTAQDGGPIDTLYCEQVLNPPEPPNTPAPKTSDVVALQLGGGGGSGPIGALSGAISGLRRGICTLRSFTTVQVRNNTTRYTRWLRNRSLDYMGLLRDYIGALQSWQGGLQQCLDNAPILERQRDVQYVITQLLQLAQTIDLQRGIDNPYTFVPGTPQSAIMDHNGVCTTLDSYCVLRDDVLTDAAAGGSALKLALGYIGVGGYAQGGSAMTILDRNGNAQPTVEFQESCGSYLVYLDESNLGTGPVAPPETQPQGKLAALQATPPPATPPEAPPVIPVQPSLPRVRGYFLLDPIAPNLVLADEYSWVFFTRPMMEVLSNGGSTTPFQNSPLGDKYLATIPGTDDSFGGIRRRPEDECPPGDTSYPCTRDDGFYNELTNPKVADYVQSLALAFFDAHVHYDEQNRRRPARTFLKSNQVREASGQEVDYRYK